MIFGIETFREEWTLFPCMTCMLCKGRTPGFGSGVCRNVVRVFFWFFFFFLGWEESWVYVVYVHVSVFNSSIVCYLCRPCQGDEAAAGGRLELWIKGCCSSHITYLLARLFTLEDTSRWLDQLLLVTYHVSTCQVVYFWGYVKMAGSEDPCWRLLAVLPCSGP